MSILTRYTKNNDTFFTPSSYKEFKNGSEQICRVFNVATYSYYHHEMDMNLMCMTADTLIYTCVKITRDEDGNYNSIIHDKKVQRVNSLTKDIWNIIFKYRREIMMKEHRKKMKKYKKINDKYVVLKSRIKRIDRVKGVGKKLKDNIITYLKQ